VSDRALLEFLLVLGLAMALPLGLVVWLIVSVFRQEAAMRAVVARALALPVRYPATIVTAYGMKGQGWVYDVRVEHPGGAFVARVTQLVPKWVAAGLVPGRAVVAGLDPTNPQVAVLDLAAMGFQV
jgi:hypothetical protein